ncbi:MAG: EAL domain-containing protein [Gammaproteobacteria bacterium]|nr:EAL domain-containing protein [Gammaproteobacteria bacterium]
MINLSHELNIYVVAEGVETKQQADILSGMVCDELQGYYFSKPLAAHDFEQWWLNYGN